MDFQKTDIKRFLVDSIPSRFHNLSPSEFTSLMAHVFRTDGYSVDEIEKKGDLAPTLLANKEGTSLVIKALRYPPEHLVKIHEIQQAAASRDYYETDQAWIITTSSFSEEAKKHAEELDVELWDWEAFYNALTQLFFEGKSHFEFIDGLRPATDTEIRDPGIKLKAKWKPEEGISSDWYNLDLVISNPSENNIYIHLDLPALIDQKKDQVTADQWAENEFVAGMIYSGASVRTNALFKASRLGERPPGGKVMLTCHERTDPPQTYHLSAKLKGSACYIVTYCYSRNSDEYQIMTRYRDEVLANTVAGRVFINAYYLISPVMIKCAARSALVDITLKYLAKGITSRIKKKYS